MRPYVHNPKLFRDHFAGKGLPAFKGSRMQRGYGLTKKLKRFTVPLLMAGVKAAAPHVSKAAGQAASVAIQKAFPNNPGMQRFVGKVATGAANRVITHATKRLPGNRKAQKRRAQPTSVSRPAKRQQTTPNIFE